MFWIQIVSMGEQDVSPDFGSNRSRGDGVRGKQSGLFGSRAQRAGRLVPDINSVGVFLRFNFGHQREEGIHVRSSLQNVSATPAKGDVRFQITRTIRTGFRRQHGGGPHLEEHGDAAHGGKPAPQDASVRKGEIGG